MSDIGILNAPGELAVIVLILGWPFLLSGAVIGAIVGWLVGRKGRPFRGAAAGLLAGLAVGAAGFVAYAYEWIGR